MLAALKFISFSGNEGLTEWRSLQRVKRIRHPNLLPITASWMLDQDGAIVDVGGGTTGIAILHDGKVAYTADEPTGGTHFSLVIAGANNISFENAEKMKLDPTQQNRLFPIIRPVMEKVASIVNRHIHTYHSETGIPVEQVVMVGGTAKFPGIAGVLQEFTGIPTSVPERPLFVTPMGIAMNDQLEVI